MVRNFGLYGSPMTKKIGILLVCMGILSSIQSQFSILSTNNYENFHTEKVSIDFISLSSIASQKQKNEVSLAIYGKNVNLVLTPVKVMSPELAKKYPTIKTFKAHAKDSKISGRITIGAFGLYAQLSTDLGLVSIYPDDYNKSGIHEVRLGNDPSQKLPTCHVTNHTNAKDIFHYKMNEIANGGTKRNYTMAIVTTHEFFNMAGSTEESATEAVVAMINAINDLYEKELAVNFILLPPKIFSTPDDPFEPDLDRPDQANDAVFEYFEYDEFDIGHVINGWDPAWPGGGVTYTPLLCDGTNSDNSFKAGGWTGGYIRLDIYFVFLFAHELGHMLGATHTWNGSGGSCIRDQYALDDAYEMGSGSTIMSYNGFCGAGQNTPRANQDFFHSSSIIKMIDHMQASRSSCVQLVEEASGNEPPQVDVDPCDISTFSIPHSTPFLLHGQVVDDKGRDDLTYAWEQYDADSTTQGFVGEEAAQSMGAPLFKTLNPSDSPIRYFPELNITFNSLQDNFQVLPAVAREMNFKFVARDNDSESGGIGIDGVTVNVSEFGPFQITSMNDRRFSYGDELTITWNTNGSEGVCENLAVLLSYNGGASFDFTLAEGLPYADGEASFIIPENTVNTTFAMLMLACDDNSCIRFYDLYKSAVSFNTACETMPSAICDVTPISAEEGSAELDLDLEVIISEDLIAAKSTSCGEPGPQQSSSTDYIFIAVSQDDNIIKAVSSAGDFRALVNGKYDVYGVSYKSQGTSPPAIIDPDTWIGQDLDEAINLNVCAQKSINAVALEITGGVDLPCGLTYDLGPTIPGFLTKRCLADINYNEHIRDSEAFIINNLISGRKYIFNFCNGYNEEVFEARVVVQEYDSENGAIGNIISTKIGCLHTIRIPATSTYDDVLIIITDNNDCQSTSKNLENGVPQFKCAIGRAGDDDLYNFKSDIHTDTYDKKPATIVYPNPVKEELNILIENLEAYEITITDLAGSILLAYQDRASIDVSSLPNGLYLIHVHSEENDYKVIEKFVVLR